MRAYQFTFYTFYTFFENWSPSKQALAFRASSVVIALETWLALSLWLLVALHYRKALWPPLPVVAILGLVILLADYLAFRRGDRWRSYAKEFDRWSKPALRLGRSIVAVTAVLIVAAYFVLLRAVSMLARP
jgi:hypothetical protein